MFIFSNGSEELKMTSVEFTNDELKDGLLVMEMRFGRLLRRTQGIMWNSKTAKCNARRDESTKVTRLMTKKALFPIEMCWNVRYNCYERNDGGVWRYIQLSR